MEHTRQSGLDFGLHFQTKALETFQVAPSSLGSGGKRDSRFVDGAEKSHEAAAEHIYGTHKTVKARSWPSFSGESP